MGRRRVGISGLRVEGQVVDPALPSIPNIPSVPMVLGWFGAEWGGDGVEGYGLQSVNLLQVSGPLISLWLITHCSRTILLTAQYNYNSTKNNHHSNTNTHTHPRRHLDPRDFLLERVRRKKGEKWNESIWIEERERMKTMQQSVTVWAVCYVGGVFCWRCILMEVCLLSLHLNVVSIESSTGDYCQVHFS